MLGACGNCEAVPSAKALFVVICAIPAVIPAAGSDPRCVSTHIHDCCPDAGRHADFSLMSSKNGAAAYGKITSGMLWLTRWSQKAPAPHHDVRNWLPDTVAGRRPADAVRRWTIYPVARRDDREARSRQ